MSHPNNNDPEKEERQRQKLMQEVFDGQLKLYGALLDKAIAYNNAMMAIGYAGFFGLWTGTKGYLTKQQALWAALLMLISLAVFVSFEIVRAVLYGLAARRRATAMFPVHSELD